MKRRNIIILMISLSIVLLLGSSYALLRSTKVGTNPYVINVANLRVEFADGKTDKLTLENQVPIRDNEGLAQDEELVFTVTNTGTYQAGYKIYMEELSTNPEFKSVIRYIVNKENKGYYEIKNLEKDKYIEKEDYLDINESKEYRVKLWLDYNAGNEYMSTEESKKVFKAKIVVEALQADNIDKSGANSPKLVSNLIPVYYDEAEKVFKKADDMNVDNRYKWYDYENKEEATAVKIQNTNSYIIDNENKTFALGENHDMYFDGVSDYYNLGHASYDFGSSISMVARVKFHKSGVGQEFMGNWEGAGGGFTYINNQKMQFNQYIEGTGYVEALSTKTYDIETWYTVVGTYDNEYVRLYIDGEEVAKSNTVSGNIRPSLAPITLGANPSATGIVVNYSNATISDAFVYTDALTADEIKNYFNGEITSYPEDNLLISNKDIHSKEGHYTLVNDGIYFNGEDDYLSLGYENYDFGSSISMVARIKPLRINYDNLQQFFGNHGSKVGGIEIGLEKSNVIGLGLYLNGVNNILLGSKTIIQKDNWYDIVITYDGAEIKMYVNGNLENSKVVSGNYDVSNMPISLGAHLYDTDKISGNYSNMIINKAFIYTDALTEEEVREYFSGEINYYPKDNLLISYDKFKETTDMEDYYQKADKGVKVMTDNIEANFKWIPRFQYDTNLKFIKGIEKPEKTHAAFTYNNNELLGYYVTDNSAVKINNIENISDYHAISSNELDGVKKLNPSDNTEYKQTLAIFQE